MVTTVDVPTNLNPLDTLASPSNLPQQQPYETANFSPNMMASMNTHVDFNETLLPEVAAFESNCSSQVPTSLNPFDICSYSQPHSEQEFSNFNQSSQFMIYPKEPFVENLLKEAESGKPSPMQVYYDCGDEFPVSNSQNPFDTELCNRKSLADIGDRRNTDMELKATKENLALCESKLSALKVDYWCIQKELADTKQALALCDSKLSSVLYNCGNTEKELKETKQILDFYQGDQIVLRNCKSIPRLEEIETSLRSALESVERRKVSFYLLYHDFP
jgi:hypothetical protein